MQRLIFILIFFANLQIWAEDPFLWLEDLHSPKAQSWVKKQNQRSFDHFRNDARFRQIYDSWSLGNSAVIPPSQFRKGRIPTGKILDGQMYYAFAGNLFRAPLSQITENQGIQWEKVVDINTLSTQENRHWVYRDIKCLKNSFSKCLLMLSHNGGDALNYREFDLNAKAFTKEGFYLPLSKSRVNWANEETLIVNDAATPNSKNSAGYPRMARLWKRGQSLEEAQVLYEAPFTDVSLDVGPMDNDYFYVWRSSRQGHVQQFLINSNGKEFPLHLPSDSIWRATINQKAIFKLKSPWKRGSQQLPQGAIVSVPSKDITSGKISAPAQVIYNPHSNESIEQILPSQKGFYTVILKNVYSRLSFFSQNSKGQWSEKVLPLPQDGSIRLSKSDKDSFWVRYSNLLNPGKVYRLKHDELTLTEWDQKRAQFNVNNFTARQLWAISKDGTPIPYFVVAPKNISMDGNHPVLITAYGGFSSSELPQHPWQGSLWLERGGLLVIPNLRGGGEFGPRWHKAATLKNKQKSYDDLIAVSESLIELGYTRKRKIGISGGSNGGLLVTAVMAQRPDLFGAVDSNVPLIDMLRYDQLSSGASWIKEYGDPQVAEMREVISKYSPYQNIQPDVLYPTLLLTTSTSDDRVHPGHARKMAAKMQTLGHNNVYFYESPQGGHQGALTPEQTARLYASKFTLLYQALMDSYVDPYQNFLQSPLRFVPNDSMVQSQSTKIDFIQDELVQPDF